jgi:Secretion system C-terminal sorting domain
MKSQITALLLLFACSVAAQTNVGGTFFSNQYWPLTGSPYVVTSDVQIAPGFSLTIDPGVHVSFGGGAEILIKGSFSALGTPGNEIVLDGSGATHTIHFLDANLSLSHLSHCRFQNGGNGIFLDGNCTNSTNVEASEFTNCEILQYANTGTLQISNTIFTDAFAQSYQYQGRHGRLLIDGSRFYQSRTSAYTDNQQPPYTLVVTNSTFDNSSIETAQGSTTYGTSMQMDADTMRNCIFHSQYSGGLLTNCYIVDSEFSNNNFPIHNIFDYDLKNSIILNTDFVGGTVLGNPWVLAISLDHCLIENTVPKLLAFDEFLCQNSSIIGPGSGLGVHSSHINAQQSLFKNFDRAVHYSKEYLLPADSLYQCNFIGNSTYNVICDSTFGINAHDSWWDTADSLTIFTKIKDYYDNLSDGEVLLGTWATSPDTNAPMSAPQGFTATAGSGFHTLSWDPNAEGDLVGYFMYLGVGSTGYNFAQGFNLGNVTTYQLADSLFNMGVAITAYDHGLDGYQDIVEGHESAFARLGGIVASAQPPADAGLVMQAFPNPSTDQFQVAFAQPVHGLALTLYDLQGRIVAQQRAQGLQADVDVSHLPSGMYLLQAKDAVLRIAIQR